MKVLLIGNGGREHALAWKLSQSPLVDRIFVAPGNGGTSLVSKTENVPIGSSKSEFAKLVEFAVSNDVGLVVPGPEQPLVEGVTDQFTKKGIPVFGPTEAAARMEGSKTFSKDFMARHNIPTAKFGNFTDYESAKTYLNSLDLKNSKVVIKASGLAAGKGVLIPETEAEALDALEQVMLRREFGDAGDEVVIEEFLEGDELSILAFSDGYTVKDLPPAQDHKRALDGDNGLNTGGMGAYAPTPIATPDLIKKIRSTILEPTIRGMRHDGYPFVGVLFVGIMLTPEGPKVLEYNVRFGDPEIQTLISLMESDIAVAMMACIDRRLDAVKIEVAPGYGATVVIAAGGYPQSYDKGDKITVGPLPPNTQVFHAGTTKNGNGEIVTSGGRVLAVTSVAPTLREAVDLAYAGVKAVSFRNMHFRTDIAHRAFRQAASKRSLTYADAGVSVDNGNQLVEDIKEMVASTRRVGADAKIGGFGGLFDLKACGFRDPILVSATDGVGTKLKIAQDMNKHDTVGIDLVAMNVNDLVVQGAEPLFFLDYFSSGHLEREVTASFVSGVANGCKMSGCALVGGETSEMPGLYQPGDYDVNGTCVGAVERDEVLPYFDKMAGGNVLLGLESSGVHSNGFSLIRKVLEISGLEFTDPAPWIEENTAGISAGVSLLEPTRIYVKPLLATFRELPSSVLGLAHITGGGLVENVPRMLPSTVDAVIDVTKWELPAVFKWLREAGNVPIDDIAKTLNMGIGMVLVVEEKDAQNVQEKLEHHGEKVHRIGSLVEGTGKCHLRGTESWM